MFLCVVIHFSVVEVKVTKIFFYICCHLQHVISCATCSTEKRSGFQGLLFSYDCMDSLTLRGQ